MGKSSSGPDNPLVHWRQIMAIAALAGVVFLCLVTHVSLLLPGVYLVMSFVALLLYGLDKRRARRDQWRIPEATLLLADLLCGWPGGLLGQGLWRHKNRKISYQLRYWLMVVINLAGLGLWLWLVRWRS